MSIYLSPHLSLLDTTTQTIAAAGTPQLVTFDTTILTKKIVKTSTSRFTVNEAGDYVVYISGHITAGSANKTLDIWARVNGTDVANSNTKTTVVNNETQLFETTIVVLMTAGQYIEIWMNGDDTSLNLVAYAAGTTPTRPVTPSIRLTIDRLP